MSTDAIQWLAVAANGRGCGTALGHTRETNDLSYLHINTDITQAPHPYMPNVVEENNKDARASLTQTYLSVLLVCFLCLVIFNFFLMLFVVYSPRSSASSSSSFLLPSTIFHPAFYLLFCVLSLS